MSTIIAVPRYGSIVRAIDRGGLLVGMRVPGISEIDEAFDTREEHRKHDEMEHPTPHGVILLSKYSALLRKERLPHYRSTATSPDRSFPQGLVQRQYHALPTSHFGSLRIANIVAIIGFAAAHLSFPHLLRMSDTKRVVRNAAKCSFRAIFPMPTTSGYRYWTAEVGHSSMRTLCPIERNRTRNRWYYVDLFDVLKSARRDHVRQATIGIGLGVF